MKRNKCLSALCALALVLSLVPVTGLAAGAETRSDGATTVTTGRVSAEIKEDGSLWMWGSNDRGQVGNGGKGDQTDFNPALGMTVYTQTTPVKIMDNVAAVDIGSNCVGALKMDGTLWMWGGSLDGELGDGDGSQHIQWTPKKILDNVVQFSIGDGYVGAVKKDGSLYMWGSNDHGQLGLSGGNYTDSDPFLGTSSAAQTIPVRVMPDVAQVSCGSDHTGIVKTDGSLWVCGDNTNGQLGNGEYGKNTGSSTFIKLMDNAAAVMCSGNSTFVLKKDNTLWSFGFNGQEYGGRWVFDLGYEEGNVTLDLGTTPNGKQIIRVIQTVPKQVMTGIRVDPDGSVWWESQDGYAKLMDGTETALSGGSQPAQPEIQPPHPEKPSTGVTFTDVPAGKWFTPYVTELATLGGVRGYEDGTFRPDGAITRAEVCTILLGSFPVDKAFESTQISQAAAQAEQANGSFWANGNIGRANLCGIRDFGYSKAEWNKPATREEIAHMLRLVYTYARKAQGNNTPLTFSSDANLLIGDYATAVAGTRYENDILWLYGSGIVSGMNEKGDFQPKSGTTRAQCCTMVVSLLHPESWKQIDWDTLLAEQSKSGTRLADGKDFKGKSRIHYSNDVAYEFCRALENQIGIQIFYLPEWTPKSEGLIQYSDIEQFGHTGEYFADVLAELRVMKVAYDLYPEGFLKEVAQKKGSRGVEIILCPYTFEGMQSYGVHVYDYSNDKKKVDQIYYTGSGDSQYYSHEMGHMVMSSAAILNGWNNTCSTWEGLSTSPMSYVSSYAMTSRPEDWADTWAYLWHRTNNVVSGCSDSGLKSKVQYMSQILDKNYSTFDSGKTPWASVLN